MKQVLKDTVIGVALLGGIIMAAATLIVTLYTLSLGMEKEIKVTTNIVKQTLIDRRNVILQEIQTSEAQRNELIVKRAEELFKEVLVDFPEISLSFSYGDTLYFNVDKKEIFSITSRRWGKDSNHYLNARSTDFYSFNVNSEFEYRRLIFNGKVAEVLYKKRKERKY